ncbi:MAG: hypothetical protein ABF289_18835 [Clostridiales bacterium]
MRHNNFTNSLKTKILEVKDKFAYYGIFMSKFCVTNESVIDKVS